MSNNELLRQLNEELMVIENLMNLAFEDGRGSDYRELYREFNQVRDERDFIAGF